MTTGQKNPLGTLKKETTEDKHSGFTMADDLLSY